MLYKIRAHKSLEQIDQALQETAARHQFGILAVHDLRQTMQKKGIELGMECRIYEVCNPLQAKKVLEAKGDVSTALPCRISVYGSGRDYMLATLLPTYLMKSFDAGQLAPVAQEVENVICEMMREAAGPQ